MSDFRHVITSMDDLEAVYGPPAELVRNKYIDRLDEHCRAIIALSPFVAIAAANDRGTTDVSPRGGPPGFVRVVDDRRLLVPDATGNHTCDILHHIVSGGRVGLLFTIPVIGQKPR